MKTVLRVGAAFLLALLFLVPVLSVPAAAEAADLRYGTGSSADTVLTADALFAGLFPEEAPLAEAEAAYLRTRNELTLRYRSDVPDAIVGVTYNGETGVLTVTVPPYRYTAENGAEVVWVPATVAMDGGAPVPLLPDGNARSAAFGDHWYSEDFDLTVTFRLSLEIPADVADALLTLPAAAADELLAAQTAYENAQAVHTAQTDAYNAYLAAHGKWETDRAAYQAYREALTAYTARREAYETYLAAQAAYDAQMAAYEAVRPRKEAYEKALYDYYHYEALRQQNAALYDRYEAYLAALEGAASRLAILESMFVADSHGWQFYGSLMGGTVTELLNNRDQLTRVNVSQELIDNAIRATNALRELMKGYADLRAATYENDLARTAALFAYYSEHYAELRTQMGELHANITAIYNNGPLQVAMENHPKSKDRVPHFRQFLAQLYLLRCCLNDIETFDPAWTLPLSSETALSLIEEPLRLTDANRADPTGVTLPTEEVSLGKELPEPVPFPVKDFEDVEMPTEAPEPVADPGAAPTPVADPGAEPAPVAAPGDAPVAPAMTATERALLAARRNGELPDRAAKGASQTLVLTRDVTARRSISNRKTVTFYGPDGTVLSARSVEYGSEITDPPAVTTPVDPAWTYTFLGWIPYGSDATEPVGLADVTSNLSLSPLFSRQAKYYPVSWSAGGRTAVVSCRYGEIPVCPLDTARPGTVSTVYTFIGWDREIGPVTAAVTYTARYMTSVARYQVVWDLGDRTVSLSAAYGTTPSFEGTPTRAPDGNLYTFRAWDRAVTRVTGDATYTAVWRVTPLLKNAEGNACRTEHDDGNVVLWPETDRVDLSVAAPYAISNGKTLCLRRGEVELTFTPAQLNALSGALCTQLQWTVEPNANGVGSVFRTVCLNSLGRELQTPAALLFSVTVRYPATEGLYAMAYRLPENGASVPLDLSRYAGGRATFTAAPGETVLCRPEYRLQYAESTLCNTSLLPVRAAPGETVSLDTDCTYGYEVSGATLVYANGTREAVGPTFVMPAEGVRVELNVTEIVYHITFVANGEIVSVQERKFGEAVEIPPDPTRPDDEENRYLFTGWSPYVTRATGEDHSPVYTATFSATPHSKDEIRVNAWAFFRSPLFLGAVAVVLLLIAGIVLLVFRKKIFRKRPKQEQAAPADGPTAEATETPANDPAGPSDPE